MNKNNKLYKQFKNILAKRILKALPLFEVKNEIERYIFSLKTRTETLKC